MTVAMMNMVAKKPNETINPTADSVASLVFACTSCSKVFISIPPSLFLNSISDSYRKIYKMIHYFPYSEALENIGGEL